MLQNKRCLYLLTGLLLFLPARSSASAAHGILIDEIQTGSATSASEEFIELYNAGDQAVDVSSYKVQYFSASSTDFNSPSRNILLHGNLASGQHYLLASTDYLNDLADDHFSATLAKTGGHVRLVHPDILTGDVATDDLVGWGTATMPKGQAALAPNGGESLQRKTDSDGLFVDTENNNTDFAVNGVPTPQSGASTTDSQTTDSADPTASTNNDTANLPAGDPTASQEDQPQTNQSADLVPISISELLPNPAPPQTDAVNEFVELYNPNDQTVDLNGYKLQTGSSFSHSFTFTDETIPAGSYSTFYITKTKVALANSGGQARLVDPNGQVVSQTDAYEDAPDGEAWALIDGNWQWTTTPTPDAANILTLPVLSETKSRAVKKPAAKVKGASTNKKTSKKTALATTDRNNYEPPADATTTPLHPAVLAGIGGLTLAYGGYEYRYDFTNRLKQLKHYRTLRRANRRTA